MKKIHVITLFALLVLGNFSAVPAVTSAEVVGSPPVLDYSGFVKCDGVKAGEYDKATGKFIPKPGEEKRQEKCDFEALMGTIDKTINWAFVMSIPVATALFAWAGLLYMTGTSGNRTKANTIFTSVGIGFIIAISAWFIVTTVVNWFVDKDVGATIFLGK